jgi:hypothetical protein
MTDSDPRPDELNDAQLLAWLGTDARRWAQEFLRIRREIVAAADHRDPNDEGWLVGWFANAIGAGEMRAAQELAQARLQRDQWRERALGLHDPMQARDLGPSPYGSDRVIYVDPARRGPDNQPPHAPLTASTHDPATSPTETP